MSTTITSLDQMSDRPERFGRLVRPSDPGWDEARGTFNLLDDQQPVAIAFPASPDEVAAVVRYARDNGLRIAAQATGHNASALGRLDDTLILNTSALKGVHIDPETRRVRVGAATKWAEVTPRLSELGLAALHGSSPDVGIVGYALGGGIGWLSRMHGLMAGSVTAIELVTAGGRRLQVDATSHPELFWALRGGGGSFGVVTAIEFSVVPLEEVYAGAMFFPVSRIREVLTTWAELLPTLPDELTTWASVIHFPPFPSLPDELRGKSYMIVMGAYLGDEARGRVLLEPLRRLGPDMDTFAMQPPAVLGELAMDPPDPLPFRSRTALLDRLPDAAIETVARVAGEGSALGLVEFRHTGGALSRPTPGAGARETLPGNIAFLTLGVVPDPGLEPVVQDELSQVAAAVAPYRVGDYFNFVMEETDASSFYDAETWQRLRQVKTTHDPDDLFRGNHHIPPSE